MLLSLIGAMIGVEFGIFFSWLIEIMVPRMSAILPTLYPSMIEVLTLVVECLQYH
jgi:ABC-type lipoprotein release transport system permease subunit